MRLLLVMIATLTTIHAFASETTNQFFWQPKAQEHYLTPGIVYDTSKQDFSDGTGSTKGVTSEAVLSYYYGITDRYTIGVSTDYAFGNTVDNGTKTNHNGMGDLNALFRGSSPAGGGDFKFGGTLSISPGPREIKPDGDTNHNSGRTLSLEPYLGYQVTKGEINYGGQIAYFFGLTDQQRKEDAQDITVSVSGGKRLNLKAFAEDLYSHGIFGADVFFNQAEGSTGTNGTFAYHSDAWSDYGLNLYATYILCSRASLIGNVNGVMYSKTSDLDSGSGYGASLYVRIQL